MRKRRNPQSRSEARGEARAADSLSSRAGRGRAGVVLLAGMILFYETVGGMHAVAWTDALQGVLMMVGLGALLHWLLAESDGFGPLTSQILEVRPGAAELPDAREQINGFSTIVLVGLASVVYPAGDPAHLRGAARPGAASITRADALHAARDNVGGHADRPRRKRRDRLRGFAFRIAQTPHRVMRLK